MTAHGLHRTFAITGLALGLIAGGFGCGKTGTLSVKPSDPETAEILASDGLKQYIYKKILLLPIEPKALQRGSQLAIIKSKEVDYYTAKVEKALLAQGFEIISSEIVARAEKSLGSNAKNLSAAQKAMTMGKETKADAVFIVQSVSAETVQDYYTVEKLKTAKVDAARVKTDRKGRLYHEETEACVFHLPYYEVRFEGKLIDAKSGNVLWVGTTRQDVIDELQESWVAKLDKKCRMDEQNFVFSDYVRQESTLDATVSSLLSRVFAPLKQAAFAGEPFPAPKPKVTPKPEPKSEPKPEPEPPKPMAFVSAKTAWMRTGPGSRNDRLMRVTRKTKVEIIETMGEWSKVKLQNGTEGWLHESTIIPIQ